MAAQRIPRGIRNNNPGNIRKTAGWHRWKGVSPNQTDPEFVQFLTPKDGIRALAKTLLTYRRVYGLDTVGGIINRWAPPSENDTRSYATAVALHLKVGVNDKLDMAHFNTMMGLVSAIIRHENGKNPYTKQELTAGIKLAGVTKGVPNE